MNIVWKDKRKGIGKSGDLLLTRRSVDATPSGDRNEAGNILWGATSKKLGIGNLMIHAGVHAFSLLDEGRFDEKGEQVSIAIGRIIYERYWSK